MLRSVTDLSSSNSPLVRTCRAAFEGFDLHTLAQTTSTQDRVRAAARAGADAGYCVVADAQTAGRGRQGRRWDTPPNAALLMSILVDRGRNPGAIPLAAGLAVCDALAELEVTAQLKWPNDVLVSGRKLAGILAEIEPRAVGADVALGIGMNLEVREFRDGAGGVSLHELAAKPASRATLLALIVPALRRRLDALDANGVAAISGDWRRRATGIGKTVVATTPTGTFHGIAVDIDSDGALLVDTATGRIRLIAGDVHLIG